MTSIHRFWLVLFLFLAILLLWKATNILLIIFSGFLVGLFLRAIAKLVERFWPMADWAAVLITVTAMIGLVVGFGFLVAPSLSQQYAELRQKLPKSVDNLRDTLDRKPFGDELLNLIEQTEIGWTRSQEMLASATGFLSSTMAMFAGVLMAAFIGIFGAIDPQRYRYGVVTLVQPKYRDRADEVMDRVVHTLRSWMLGKVFAMLLVGTLTYIGLLIIGIPLALTLAMLAALLTFIPNVGPALSVVPALLLAFMESASQALYVAVLYSTIQLVESYIITPLIFQHAIALPPAFTISIQAVMGILMGFLGLALAVPLAAAFVVLCEATYIEDALGDTPEST